MTRLLAKAADQFGIPTEESAGPENMPGVQLWARWPRHHLEVAHDILNRIMTLHDDVEVSRLGTTGKWQALSADWTFEGDFEDAVAELALHLRGAGAPGRPPRASARMHLGV